MNRASFNKLKNIGHWCGMLLFIVGMFAGIKYKNPLFFLAGILGYWVLNYLLIRGIFESRFVKPSDADS